MCNADTHAHGYANSHQYTDLHANLYTYADGHTDPHRYTRADGYANPHTDHPHPYRTRAITNS